MFRWVLYWSIILKRACSVQSEDYVFMWGRCAYTCTCLEDQWWLIVVYVKKCKHGTPFVNILKTVRLTEEIAGYKEPFVFLDFFFFSCVKRLASCPQGAWSTSSNSLCEVIVGAIRSKWKLTLHDNFFFCGSFQYEISWKSAHRSSICYKRSDSERTSRTPQRLHVEEIGCEGAVWIEVARLEDFVAIWMKL